MGGAVFPPCCLTWGQTMVQVMKIMATSFERAHAELLHSVLPTLQQTTADPYLHRRHSTQFCLSLCGVPGSWCTQGLFEPSERLWWIRGLMINAISLPLSSFLGFPFALGHGVSFLLESNIVQSTVVQQGVVVLEFSQGKMSTRPSTQHIPGQFSFQFQRKAMPKNVQTAAQLHFSHTLAK